MQIPFIDLGRHHASVRDELLSAVADVVDSNAFAGGPFVEKFEEDFAAFCGTKYAVGVGSGTDALWLSLEALGIGKGDEVITAVNTFIATAEAISRCGATPVFVDIDPSNYNLDPEKVEAAVTPRTKAIIPVHLYGQLADMSSINSIAERHGLKVVEDASQAHGAESAGKKAGSFGDAGCFSFYPGKNLGALGEAGAVVTDRKDLCERIKMLRDHGQGKKYFHEKIGWNARMDGIQGAVLATKLKNLAENNKSRRLNARYYSENLQNLEEITIPDVKDEGAHVFHLYVIRSRNRDELALMLKEYEISTGIHYPVPLHMQKAYKFLGLEEGDFPEAERCAGGILSLPMFPELTHKEIETVVEVIKLWTGKQRAATPMEVAC